MSAKASDLESRAEALLKRIHRHNLGMDSLTAMEVQSLLKEIRAIGEMNLARSLPDDILARVDRLMQQAVRGGQRHCCGSIRVWYEEMDRLATAFGGTHDPQSIDGK